MLRVKAHHERGAERDTGICAGANDAFRPGNVQRERFFAEDMLARAGAGNRMFDVRRRR